MRTRLQTTISSANALTTILTARRGVADFGFNSAKRAGTIFRSAAGSNNGRQSSMV